MKGHTINPVIARLRQYIGITPEPINSQLKEAINEIECLQHKIESFEQHNTPGDGRIASTTLHELIQYIEEGVELSELRRAYVLSALHELVERRAAIPSTTQ